MRNSFFSQLYKHIYNNKNIILLTGDLGYGMLDDYFLNLPNNIINLGIAEQSIVSIASGLATEGFKVFIYSIGNFILLRALEQIRNDIAYHNLDVSIVTSGGGYSYGQLGFTHHTLEDIAIIRSIPNFRIYSPSDSLEASCLADYCSTDIGAKYIRLEKNQKYDLSNFNNELINVTKIRLLQKGSDIAFFSYGTIIEEIETALSKLNSMGVRPSLYSFMMLWPINKSNIEEILHLYKYIIIVEEHSKYGGLYSIILEMLNDISNFNKPKIIGLGVDGKFASFVGDNYFLRKLNRLSSDDIIDTVNLIGREMA